MLIDHGLVDAAILITAASAAPAHAIDKDDLFGAAVTQWVQVNCEDADKLDKNMTVLAAAAVNQASAEELKVARKRVRDEVAKLVDQGGNSELFCSYILMRHTSE